jgi:FkbM family methyltransferase
MAFEDLNKLTDYFLIVDETRDRLAALPRYREQFSDRVPAAFGITRPASVFLGDRVLTHTHRGLKIYVKPTDVDLAPHIMMGGAWEGHVEAAIFSIVKAGQHAIDIGGNIGYHTLNLALAVGQGGRVDSFEANPELVPLLTATVFVNGFYPWVHVHHRAVMDRPGTVSLASEPGHFGSGNIVIGAVEHDANYHRGYSIKHQVEGVKLDDFFGALAKPVDFLRLDIEGAEPFAIRGAEGLLRASPNASIVLEWSIGMMAARCDVREFVDWLTSLGFRFWVISPANGAFEAVEPHATLNLPHSDLLVRRSDP